MVSICSKITMSAHHGSLGTTEPNRQINRRSRVATFHRQVGTPAWAADLNLSTLLLGIYTPGQTNLNMGEMDQFSISAKQKRTSQKNNDWEVFSPQVKALVFMGI